MVTVVTQNSFLGLDWETLIKAFQHFQEKSFKEIKARLDRLTQKKERIDPTLYCRFCSNGITSTDNAIQINGSVEHQCTNPQGNTFDISCFSIAKGCVQTGTPTFEHTWFDGYTWRFALCARCHTHIGWFYQRDHHNFYGLIRNALTDIS